MQDALFTELDVLTETANKLFDVACDIHNTPREELLATLGAIGRLTERANALEDAGICTAYIVHMNKATRTCITNFILNGWKTGR